MQFILAIMAGVNEGYKRHYIEVNRGERSGLSRGMMACSWEFLTFPALQVFGFDLAGRQSHPSSSTAQGLMPRAQSMGSVRSAGQGMPKVTESQLPTYQRTAVASLMAKLVGARSRIRERT